MHIIPKFILFFLNVWKSFMDTHPSGGRKGLDFYQLKSHGGLPGYIAKAPLKLPRGITREDSHRQLPLRGEASPRPVKVPTFTDARFTAETGPHCLVVILYRVQLGEGRLFSAWSMDGDTWERKEEASLA